MLTTVNLPQAAGINNVEWDAVELPSQFMENWCYHKNTLLNIAKHYETGERLSNENFEKLEQATKKIDIMLKDPDLEDGKKKALQALKVLLGARD